MKILNLISVIKMIVFKIKINNFKKEEKNQTENLFRNRKKIHS